MRLFSEPLRIDDRLTLPRRAFLSPLQGVTTTPFLQAANELGLVDFWMTPFYSVGASSIPSRGALRRWLAPYRKAGAPVIAQLLGHEPGPLAEAARLLADCGAEGVNLNFACPSKTVLRSGNGGACLRDESLALRITEAVAAVPGVSLSLKLRSGWVAPDGLASRVRRFCSAGAKMIVLHFRTVAEAYSPAPDREARIAKAVDAACGVPVIGNGDVVSSADAVSLVRATGCAGVAVGRAFLRDPWLIRRIADDEAGQGSADDRRTFLRALAERSLRSGAPLRRNWLIECVKLAFGAESEEFRRAIRGNGGDLLSAFEKR